MAAGQRGDGESERGVLRGTDWGMGGQGERAAAAGGSRRRARGKRGGEAEGRREQRVEGERGPKENARGKASE